MNDAPSLLERDLAHVWHPLTQHATEPAPIPVVGAEDAMLHLEDGRSILDGISSWWACLHGHGRQELIQAMTEQAEQLDHVLFAGVTHEPGVALSERLIKVAPGNLNRVFFSDNGSTAIEVALKIAFQSWMQKGQPERRTFITFENSYHGETVGAMSVGDPDPYFLPFKPLMFEVVRIPLSPQQLEENLSSLGNKVAGVVLEPMLQAAGGMLIQAPETLAQIGTLCKRFGVPLIADEVMTGFGRTGTLFACEQGSVEPDLLCLSKGLTGGVLPLAVTLATESLFKAFWSDDRRRAFFHSHTYTANPIGCAVALASLELTLNEDVPAKLNRIGERIHRNVLKVAEDPELVSDHRRIGGVVALDLVPKAEDTAGYLSQLGPWLRREAIERGVFLRPLGNVLYAMPPACTTMEQCDVIAEVMCDLASLRPAG